MGAIKRRLGRLWSVFILFHGMTLILYAQHKEQISPGFSNIQNQDTRDFKDSKQLKEFYQDRNLVPVWLDSQGLTEAGQNALITLQNAEQEGLDGRFYQPLLKKLQTLDFPELSEQEILDYDSLFTRHVSMYLEDMEGERLSPEKVNKQIHLKAKDVKPYHILSRNIALDSTGRWLISYTNPHKDYQELKVLLAHYRQIESQGGWPFLELSLSSNLKLETGKSAPLVEVLKRQLEIQGDLNPEEAQGPEFTPALEVALKQFQHRHGLEEDGKVGKETLNALNVPVETRIRQIIISMERWRWAPEERQDRFILVNIAGYYLQAFDKNQKVLEMPVIIGQQFRQTPVFVSQIDLIRFNPAWHVPQSIAVKDKLPLLRSKPSYFKEKGYSIYDSGGGKVNPEDIDWEEVSSRNFNYKLVQKPGADNALGRLFFHINTPFDIFLHSTPDMSLFKKNRRSFSSGCIRVGDSLALAHFVLNNEEKWSREYILQVIEQEDTKNVVPTHFINVYVTYQTVWIDDQKRPHFVEDLYGQDKTIEKALFSESFYLK